MTVTHYSIKAKTEQPVTIALVADLHGDISRDLLETIRGLNPDMIAATGDYFGDRPVEFGAELAFLSEMTKAAPVFFSLGNHERKMDRDSVRRIESSGAVVLDNRFTRFMNISVGGLTSGFGEKGQTSLIRTPAPNLSWLGEFENLHGYKLLLCHHPEYYEPFIRPTGIQLTLAGHAHGGQWRVAGRGVFAPGQHIFPKYTSGVYENRLVVSRGLANLTWIPRINNRRELVVIDLVLPEPV